MATTTRSPAAKSKPTKSAARFKAAGSATDAPTKKASRGPKTPKAPGGAGRKGADRVVAAKPKRVVRSAVARKGHGPRIKKKAFQGALARVSGSEVALSELAEIVHRSAGDDGVAGLRDALNRILAPSDPSTKPDADLWGPAPSPVSPKDGQPEASSLRELRDRAWTRREAAEHLDVTEQAVSDRVRKGQLAGLRIANRLYLLPWQFTDDGVCPGMGVLIERWPSTMTALDRWARTRHPDLGAKPADVLGRRGGLAAVLEVLEADAVSRW